MVLLARRRIRLFATADVAERASLTRLSPEDSATKRFTTIPDNNRVWLNLGASYKWSQATTIDVAYSHVFVQDGAFTQKRANPADSF